MTIYVNNLLTATEADVTGKPTPTRTWQWLRNGTAISGANSSTYTVVEADLAANLSVSQIETNLGGVDTATSTALGPVSIFGVNSLFANGEEGAWYDPSDLSTLFQDSLGTTPVTTAGQPVGLMLDKSKGLVFGVEQTTNGTFPTGIAGWTGQSDVVQSWDPVGAISVERVSGPSDLSYQAYTTVVGARYEIKVDVLSTEGGARVAFDNQTAQVAGNVTENGVAGSYRAIIVANHSTMYLHLACRSNGNTNVYDNISVRELPGNHATQATSAARPTYQTSAGLHWLAFDGVDDALAGGSIVLKLGWYSCLGLNILTRGGSNSDILGLGSRGSAPNSLSMSVRTDVVQDLRASIRLEDYIIAARRGDYEIAANFVAEGGEDTGNVFSRVNGGTIDTTSSAALTGPGSAVAVRLGDTDVEFKFYGAVLRMAATSESDKDKTRAYFATKSGVTL